MSAALVVLVNGLPGAGKTTLARSLSRRVRLPLFSKDVIKEAHAEVLGAEPPTRGPQRRWNRALGTAASDTMWALLADAPGGAILESNWSADYRHFVVDGLARPGITTVLEIFCEVPIHLARRRVEHRRPRHPIHGALPSDQEWEHWRQTFKPLEIGDTLRLDTTGPIDIDPRRRLGHTTLPVGDSRTAPPPESTARSLMLDGYQDS